MTPREVERLRAQAVAGMDQAIRAMEDEVPELVPACALMRDVFQAFADKGQLGVAAIVGRSNAMDAFAAGLLAGMVLSRGATDVEVAGAKGYVSRQLLDAVTGGSGDGENDAT